LEELPEAEWLEELPELPGADGASGTALGEDGLDSDGGPVALPDAESEGPVVLAAPPCRPLSLSLSLFSLLPLFSLAGEPALLPCPP
jgi:hypothetical protein